MPFNVGDIVAVEGNMLWPHNTNWWEIIGYEEKTNSWKLQNKSVELTIFVYDEAMRLLAPSELAKHRINNEV